MFRILLLIGIMYGYVSCTNSSTNSRSPVSVVDTTYVGKPGYAMGTAGKIYYDNGGRGELPVVFVHSFAGSSDHWQKQLEFFRKNGRAIAIDLRGHGRSDAPENMDYSVSAMASDIATVVDSLHLKSFVLVGHSMGGAASIAYAGMHPDRVAGLIMAGTPGKTPESVSTQAIASLESNTYDKVMSDYMNLLLAGAQPMSDSVVRAGYAKLTPQTGLSIMKTLLLFDPLGMLGNYTGPKLIIESANAVHEGSLHSQTTNVAYRTIEGTSHWVQMDKPATFNTIVSEFWDQIYKEEISAK